MRHLIWFVLLIGQLTYAGNGWVSTGSGDLYRSDKNPWFLHNTTIVHYCLAIDGKGISVSPDFVRAQLRAALDYWKKELSPDELTQNSATQAKSIHLGTQDFIEGSCDGKEDIKFIFGAGALNLQQRWYMKDVRRHLGLTIRTDYDQVNMKGRGFVFIASDQGTESFAGLSLYPGKLWTQKNMLLGALAHELGHVMGLPHFGSSLMSEAFAEKITSSAFSVLFSKRDGLPTVLSIPHQSESCYIDAQILRFLGVQDPGLPASGPADWCLVMKLQPKTGAANEPVIWKLSAYLKDPTTAVELGRIVIRPDELSTKPQFPLDFGFSSVSLVFLNPEQKVFKDSDLIRLPDSEHPGKQIVLDFLYGPGEMKFGATGSLELPAGTRSCYLHESPDGFRVNTEVDGESRLIFNTSQVWFF